MQAISSERSGLAQTAVVSLATLAALALLGLVLAYWTWAWLAPVPEPRSQAAQAGSLAAGPTPAAAGLFGGAQGHRAGVPAASSIKLLGVVAAALVWPRTPPLGGSSGVSPDAPASYAVFRLDAKRAVVVREGAEIEPGVRLAEVHADHVVLEQGGARETLAWTKQDKPAAPAAPRTRN